MTKDDDGVTGSTAFNFFDLTRLTAVLRVCLAVYVIVAGASAWSDWVEIKLLEQIASGVSISETDASTSDLRQTLLGAIYTIVFFTIVFVFSRWTYLANKNARALGASKMEFSPGWSVGWYFIPLFALWKPYQALKEIFKASHPDHLDNWYKAPIPAIMPLWWGLWIVSSVIGNLLLRTALSAETIDKMLASSRLMFYSDMLDVPLGFVVIALVSTLHDWQSRKFLRIHQGVPAV